jgi:hypothetical protein
MSAGVALDQGGRHDGICGVGLRRDRALESHLGPPVDRSVVEG